MAAYNYYGQNYGNPYMMGGYAQNGYPVQGYIPQQQPNQMQVQPSQQAQNLSPSGIIWVSGAQEAQMFPVGPNNAVALWENSGKTIYLKQADATGKPTIRIYDLVERTDAPTVTEQHDGKSVSYATKDDLGTVVGVIKGLSSDIEQMKSDLYGVAGRKKTVKKAEATEDDA